MFYVLNKIYQQFQEVSNLSHLAVNRKLHYLASVTTQRSLKVKLDIAELKFISKMADQQECQIKMSPLGHQAQNEKPLNNVTSDSYSCRLVHFPAYIFQLSLKLSNKPPTSLKK